MEETKFYYKNDNAPKPNKPKHIGTCAVIEYKGKVLIERRVDIEPWALIV